MENRLRIESKEKAWRDTDHNCHYYFRVENGLIVGQVHNVVHTKIWVAKTLQANGTETFIGQYISMEFAKKAIEYYWDMQERTLIE